MNNLKRVLSLGLTGAMLSGMMLVGASAADVKDFSDASEIKNQEAVTTMVALNVIAGKDTGAFDPSATVTRAEMAKMITIMLNGGKEPTLSTSSTPMFSDIGTHWAQKYIEYCAGKGVINGQGDGPFNPDGTVTGSAAAKMSLVALGYDSEVFHFTGIDWETNTNGTANDPNADLYDDISGSYDPSTGLSRDNAAQMLYNVLDAKTMTRNYDKVVSNGETTYSYSLSDKTFMEDKFGAIKVEGVVTGNEFARLGAAGTNNKGTAEDEGKTRVMVTNGEDQDEYKDNTSYLFSIATGENELGKAVSFYVKPSSTSQKSTVPDASSDSIADVADDNSLDLPSATPIYVNYGAGGTLKLADAGADGKTVEKQDGLTGQLKTLIDYDNDGDVDYIFLTSYVLGKVSRYVTTGDGAITVSNSTYAADDKDDVAGFDDVAKDDYVLAAWIGGKLHVAKAESVTGSIDAYKAGSVRGSVNTNMNSLTVDGTAYNVSRVALPSNSDLTDAVNQTGSTLLDTEAVFYLDHNGYIAGMGDVEAVVRNFAYIWGNDRSTSVKDAVVKATLSDGTTKSYTLSDNSDASVKTLAGGNADDGLAGQIYNYTITSSGELKLTAPTSNTYKGTSKGNSVITSGQAITSFSKGLRTVTYNSTAKSTATSSTAFFYVTTGNNNKTTKVSVYTGYASAPSVAAGGKIGVVENGGDAVAVVMVNSTAATASLGDNYLYIASAGSTTSDYTNATAILQDSDVIEDIKVNDDGKAPEKGRVYTYTVDSDGYYELADPRTSNGGNNETYYVEGLITSGGSSTVIIGAGIDNAGNSISAILPAGSNGEFKITNNTVIIDFTDKPSKPAVSLGGALTKQDDVVVGALIDDDELKMVVFQTRTSTSGNTPTLSTDVKVINSDKSNSYANPTFYVEDGSTIGTADMKTALAAVMAADGCTNIEFNGTASVKFTKGNNTDTTSFANGGLSAAKNQVFKYTVNGGAAKYALAATDIKADVAGGKWYTDDAGKNYKAIVTGGNTLTISKDTDFEDGYYEVAMPNSVTVSGATNAGLGSATVTAKVGTAAKAYAKASGTVTITLTSDTAPTAGKAITVSVTGTGVTAITTQEIAFSGMTATVTVSLTSGISNDVSDLAITLADKA